MAQQQPYKPIPKNPLNDYRLALRTDKIEKMGGDREPVLRLNIIKNNPRIDVYTGIPNDVDRGRISAPMDPVTFMTLMGLIESIARGENDVVKKITNYTGRPEEKRVISTTYVGKDKNGCVFISVTAKDRPKVKFKFLPSAYHVFMDKDGTIMDEGKVTEATALGWVKLVSSYTPHLIINQYEEPEYGNNNTQQSAQPKPPVNTASDIEDDDLGF